MAIESINPATGQRIRSYEEMAPATVADDRDCARSASGVAANLVR